LIGLAAVNVGIAQAALDDTIEHVKTRKNAGGVLAELPTVQTEIAEMTIAVEGARALLMTAARAADAGDPAALPLVMQSKIGATAYDPKVVPIWESMRAYFREAGVPIDYVLFSNYEAQVDALFAGSIDLAWNTNVAYVRSEQRSGGICQVLGMRNTDVGFTTRIVGRGERLGGLGDLKGKRLALGSADSAQAAILPLQWLRRAGLEPGVDVELLRFDLDVGKHGDTGTSELEVLRALHEGDADYGAVGDPTW